MRDSDKRPGLVSVVLPAFDEERTISDALGAVRAYFEPRAQAYEIVVADDGSRDATAARVRDLAESDPRIRLLELQPNRGKGRAVREGVAVTRGDIVLFLDVDLSTPVDTMERVWPEFDAGAQVVVGSRRMSGSHIEVHQSALRESLGEFFRRWVRGLTGIRVSDITCGFKVFDGDVARRLFPRVCLDDWSFDVELLVAATAAGLTIRDIPVRWRNDPDSKVRLWRDIPVTLFGVTSVLIRRLLGYYRRPLD